MKISKSWILKICFIAGLFLFAQFSFATDTTVLLPPDYSPKATNCTEWLNNGAFGYGNN